MSKSKISWTESTWNPVTGCTKISPGCLNCYAEAMAKRLQAMGQPKYKDGFQVTCHEDALGIPSKVKKPTLFFVCSMGDLFHEDVPDAFIEWVFNECYDSREKHIFQILTKRPHRMLDIFGSHNTALWRNIWWGTTIEDQERYDERAPIITEMAKRGFNTFISFEPLLGAIACAEPLPEPDWVIVGGESGPGARQMDAVWAEGILRYYRMMRIPAFFKQHSNVNKSKAGHLIDIGNGPEVIQQVPMSLERFFGGEE